MTGHRHWPGAAGLSALKSRDLCNLRLPSRTPEIVRFGDMALQCHTEISRCDGKSLEIGISELKIRSFCRNRNKLDSRARTCVKRNAGFGARVKGLSLYFLYQKGNLIRIKTGLDTSLIRIQTRILLSRYPPYDYSKAHPRNSVLINDTFIANPACYRSLSGSSGPKCPQSVLKSVPENGGCPRGLSFRCRGGYTIAAVFSVVWNFRL